MEEINPQYFEDVVREIKDGTIFEKFACDFLCQTLGVEFCPAGGVHDQGIDGIRYLQNDENTDYKVIYQISIDQSHSKVYDTLEKLKNNKIDFAELCFVTNDIVKKPDELRTNIFKKYHVLLNIYDLNWLRGNVNHSPGTMSVFSTFVDRYCHEFTSIGKTRIIEDFDGDPRILIFLRQQLDNANAVDDLQSLVLDSMIIYALEGTDPEKDIFMSKEDILKRITNIAPVRFDEGFFEKRLSVLSTKPRKINHHRQINRYCLPYTTRHEIQKLNIHDESVVSSFEKSIYDRVSEKEIGECFSADDIKNDIVYIVNEIFKRSGLEFSSFVLSSGKTQNIIQDLPTTIEQVIPRKHISLTKERKAYLCNLLLTILREIIYSPNYAERQYLSSLSKTYMTLFMLRADPKIANYLRTMARGLEIFVCSSILIPALSEIMAPEKNRRLWNMLKIARDAGVRFFVNSSIIDEIAQHIENKLREYQNYYDGNEFLYTEPQMISCIDSILIRGFFYHKLSNHSLTFKKYIDNFVNPEADKANKKYELKEFFKDEFGIEFFSRENDLRDFMTEKDLSLLTDTLAKDKPSRQQAINDANTILMIYTKRKVDNEDQNGAFGFRSWWLSTDTKTFAAVERSLGDKYSPSCYIRPDFLLNFITLSPKAKEIELAYDNIFPNTLGISLSRHIDEGFTKAISECIKQHEGYRHSRVKTIIHTEIDRLKTEFQRGGNRGLSHYIESLYNLTDQSLQE